MKVKIPEQLKKEEFRFIKIRPKSKLPLEKGWQKDNNYSFKDLSLLSYIQKNDIYGVLTGFGNLVVIDCDLRLLETIVEKNLPETFKVRTPSGGSHFYYISDLPKTKILKHPSLEDSQGAPLHLGEIRSGRSQVVGPCSFNSIKRKYYIVENSKGVEELPREELDKVLGKFMLHKKEREGPVMINPKIEEIKDAFPLKEVMRGYGYDMSKNPTKCQWHSSKGEASFAYSDKVWRCFHCLKGGSVIQLVMEHEHLTTYEAIELLELRLEKRRVMGK